MNILLHRQIKLHNNGTVCISYGMLTIPLVEVAYGHEIYIFSMKPLWPLEYQ